MKLHQYNAAAILFEKTSSIREEHDSWRAIHISLSKASERYNRTLRQHFIARGVTEALAVEDGYIYLCNDGDVFILFQGRMNPILKKLALIFEDIQTINHHRHRRNPFTLYDLSTDWQSFYDICFAKSLDAACGHLLTKNLPVGRLDTAEAPVF